MFLGSLLGEVSFLFAFARLTSPMPLVETQSDPNAVHNLGWHSSHRIPHDMFADCDLSQLSSTHSFAVIPLLLSEPAQREVTPQVEILLRSYQDS